MKRGIPGLIAYPRSRELERGGVRVRLGRMQFRIAMVYCIAAPVRLLSQEVGDYLWAGDPEGGPLNMQDTLQVHIDRANSKLSLLGIRIQADWPGSTAGRYAVDLLESGAVPGCVPGAVRVDTPHMIDSRGRLTTVRAFFQHSPKQTSRHAPARNRHVNQSCVVVAPVVAAHGVRIERHRSGHCPVHHRPETIRPRSAT